MNELAFLADEALPLIEAYGLTAEFVPQGATYDPTTGNVGNTGGAAFTLKVVQEDKTISRQDGSGLVQVTQLRLTAAAKSFAVSPPDENDKIRMNGKEYTIARVVTISAGDTPVLYQLDVK